MTHGFVLHSFFVPATCWGSFLCLCEKQAWLWPLGSLLLCQLVASGSQPGLQSLEAIECQHRGAVELSSPTLLLTSQRGV